MTTYTLTYPFAYDDDSMDVTSAHDLLHRAMMWLRLNGRIQHLVTAHQDIGDGVVAVIELNNRDTALLLKLAL